ncbi:MAG TPA: hydroxymethylbilane synthase [Burkholderiaceae bacterium]|nr:hydroxymethylbilane synthase [Burkholderiaceae bacterium]
MQRAVIATRASPLALWQAEHVQHMLQRAHPQLAVELLRLSTRGDQLLDRSLAKIGGKGLFIKELELALMDERADLAVHSFKDVPMLLEPHFEIGAVLQREDPRDCLVSAGAGGLEELPAGARVGTSSLRRELAVRIQFPQLEIDAIRGNVGTRLAKLDRGEFDALIMAAAGLKRLGLAQRIGRVLPTAQFLPAPAQGALAIEIRAGDTRTRELIAHLEHPATRAATLAERMVSRALGGSCQVPLAAYAEADHGELHLRAWAGSLRRAQAVQAQASGPFEQAEALGRAVVDRMKAQGVQELLAADAEGG